ncbi:putative F-box associated interaction domain-containing protein [Rosa chinensis]|uniref:Putative F-box associated interaction domain-containing protein n=1 Tax=Rosa chinensis TaxID=74649 RepID=A0A2P6Q064_ROSCH|nr:putative F-box associated interaction domain-containing protein [Rosa chinensis]
MEKLTFTTKNTAPVDVFTVVNSCNGLVCLSGYKEESSLIVCNPLLHEYIKFPLPSNKKWGDFAALGFSSVTNEYKLLRIFSPDWRNYTNNRQAEVYTISSGVWRSIGNAPTDKAILPFNSFLHGAIHFAPIDSRGSSLIHSFDFEREKFQALPPPSSDQALPPPSSDQLKLKLRSNRGGISLGVWESRLSYCVFDVHATKFDLWIMKEYGVQESWIKALVVENMFPTERSITEFYEPVMYLRGGEILTAYNDRIIVSYNPKTKTFKKQK